MERVTNQKIREIMKIKHSCTDDIVTKKIIWFRNLQIMNRIWIHKKIQIWPPKGKRKRGGRPKRSWIEGVVKEMKENDMEEGLWSDGKEWRREIYKRCKKNRYIYKYIYLCIYLYLYIKKSTSCHMFTITTVLCYIINRVREMYNVISSFRLKY